MQELHELRQLREENSRLKSIVADLMLDRQILQEVVSKSFKASPAQPAGEGVHETHGHYGISERRGAKMIGVPRTTLRYKSRRPFGGSKNMHDCGFLDTTLHFSLKPFDKLQVQDSVPARRFYSALSASTGFKLAARRAGTAAAANPQRTSPNGARVIAQGSDTVTP